MITSGLPDCPQIQIPHFPCRAQQMTAPPRSQEETELLARSDINSSPPNLQIHVPISRSTTSLLLEENTHLLLLLITCSVSFFQHEAMTNLRDIAGPAPAHRSKAHFATKRVERISGHPTAYAYGSEVYTRLWSVKYATALYLKNNVHTLIKKTLVLKNANHHLNSQGIILTDHRSPSQKE